MSHNTHKFPYPHHQHQNYREKSPQERLLHKVTHVQYPQDQQSYRTNYREEESESAKVVSYPVPPSRIAEDFSNIPVSESYDVIHYEEKPVTVTDPYYFHESYGQEANNVQSSEKYVGKTTSQRSRSLPPGGTNSEGKSRLGASFPYEVQIENAYANSNSRLVENDSPGDYVRNENSGERRSRQQNPYDEDVQSRGRNPSKKVSYAQGSRNDKPVPGVSNQSTPVQYRFRAESVETDDSDMSCTVSVPVPVSRKNSRSHSTGSNKNSPQRQPSRTTSERNFMFDGQLLEDFVNRNNPQRVSNQYSQESILSMGAMSSNAYYGQDVLPLPIEIPDNVADAEAFRRYLSVRRGAITPVRQQNISFETRNQSCPSYESIGRKSRKPTMALTPSGQLGQEASRRTSSLSHAIMTLALLSASICQLRFLISYSHAHSYPILNYFLVFTSIILEVAAGIGYVLISRCSYDDVQSEAIHNYLIFALFIVAVSNVILAAFAFDDHLCDEIKRINSHTSASATATQDQQFNQPVSRSDRVMDLRYMPLE